MRFIVDDQLPVALARAIAAAGHDAQHVLDIALAGRPDPLIWQRACDDGRIVVTKDADFMYLQRSRQPPRGRVLWIRLGNCRKPVLLGAVVPQLGQIAEMFDRGEWLVELR